MSGIKVGDKVPVFRLYNQEGLLTDIRKFIGKPLVIYFYPKDDTPGCTAEACSFRDNYQSFVQAGAIVFGISGDSVASHKKFRQKYQLPYDLLADEGNKVRTLFGVPSDLFGFIPGRVTYIIDRKGVVKYIYNSQLNAAKHAKEALRVIASF